MMDWSTIPDHIMVSIFSCLPLNDRTKAARVCKHWENCSKSQYLWTSFEFRFYSPEHSQCITCLEKYGDYLQDVQIKLDQATEENRSNACTVLTKLSEIENRRLKCLKVKFTGENPLFYAGMEFVSALRGIFGQAPVMKNGYRGLIDVDLSGLYAALDDSMINLLATNHPNLERLNIQNKLLVCKVSPTSILNLVQTCRKLTGLQIFQCSASEDILSAFIEEDRAPLEHLSLLCRREEKYGLSLSEAIWEKVVQKLPELRVTLWFDHTCPLHKVGAIMKYPIPCKVLRLETFSRIYDEINLASSYYNQTLEKLVVQTTSSPDLNQALLTLSNRCSKLNTLHVFCLLEKSTVERILQDHPVMKEKGWYTLKYIMEPHPWIAGGNF